MQEIKKKHKAKQNLVDYNTGGIYSYVEKIFDVAALSILWLLCSLPLITIGASTTAFYYTTVKVIKQDRGYLASEFFKAFKRNFKDSTIIWLIIAIISFVLQLNIGILFSKTSGLFGLFFICIYAVIAVLVLGVAVYVFPVISRFDMSAGWNLKLAMYMTFRYFHITLVLLLVLALSALILYYLPLFVLILPAGVMLFNSYFIEPILLKHYPKADEGHTEEAIS